MEQIVPHVVVVRLRVFVSNGVVLIKVESNNILERKAFFFMESNKFSVQ